MKFSAHIRRGAIVVITGLTPALFVWSFPFWLHWPSALPEVFEPAGDPAAVAEVLANLSLSLSSISVACVIGAALILKETTIASQRLLAIMLAVVVLAGCLVAVFAGFRFQLGLAEQISQYRLDMARIQERLEDQATASLISAAALVAMAADSFVLRAFNPLPSGRLRASTQRQTMGSRARKRLRSQGV